MRIQPINTYEGIKTSFKQNNEYQDWHDDYGTYYNNMTIKDGIISASIVSAICYIGTLVITNERELKNIVKKSKNFFCNLIKKNKDKKIYI